MTRRMKILGLAALLSAIALGAAASDRYRQLMEGAQKGDAVARFEVGTTYLDDLDPNPRDLAKARFWLVLANGGKLRGDVAMMAKSALDDLEKKITPDETVRSDGWLAEWRRTGTLPTDLLR